MLGQKSFQLIIYDLASSFVVYWADELVLLVLFITVHVQRLTSVARVVEEE